MKKLEITDKWNESDLMLHLTPEFLDIVGKHSTHWKLSKGRTLLKVYGWIQNNYVAKEEWHGVERYNDPTFLLGLIYDSLDYDNEEPIAKMYVDSALYQSFRRYLRAGPNEGGVAFRGVSILPIDHKEVTERKRSNSIVSDIVTPYLIEHLFDKENEDV